MSTEKQLAVSLFWCCPSLNKAVTGFAGRCRSKLNSIIPQRTALKQKHAFFADIRLKAFNPGMWQQILRKF